LYKFNPTLIAGGGKAGHIANNTTAQSQQSATAIETIIQQRLENAIECIEGFILLTIGQDHRFGFSISKGGQCTI